MPSSEDEPDAIIERALVRIRRDQQARQIQRRTASGPAAASAADAARFRFLDALDSAPEGRSISAVAETIGVDRPRASRLTTELLADGLVERLAAPQDSRYVLVKLTAAGRTLVDAVHENRRRSVSEALTEFTPEEARTLAELLERFVQAWPRTAPPA
jgi:DNA-binding MarR family transcriptional regulator